MTAMTEVRFRSWSACHAALFPDPTMPPHSWECSVAGYLFERGYHPESIRLVLDHATREGSVECCPDLAFSDADRAACERLMPESPIGNWVRPEFAGWWLA